MAEQAENLVHDGRLDEALSVLDSALEQAGDVPNLLRDKANIHLLKSDYVDAAKVLERLVLVEPDVPENWLVKGWTFLAQGTDSGAAQALECAERVLKLDDTLFEGHSLCGDSLLDLGRWQEAYEAFEHAAKLAPDQFNASNWAARGDRFLDDEQLALAGQAYERAIEQDEKSAEGWYGMGQVQYRSGRSAKALEAFERASAADGRFIAGFLSAGDIYFELNQPERALSSFQRAASAQPGDPRPWAYIGDAHARLGRQGEACKAYGQALALDPNDAETWNALGNSQFKLDQLDKAAQSYERALSILPDFSWSHHNMAWVRLRQRKPDEALREIEHAIELEPDSGDFWTLKLGVLNGREMIDAREVEHNADRALEACGSDSELRMYIAHFLADNGRTDRARELMHDVDGSAFDDEMARLVFGELLIKFGAYSEAAKLLDGIDPKQLNRSEPVILAFLRLLADFFVAGSQRSADLLEAFLRELTCRADSIESTSLDWSFKGMRHVLAGTNLSTIEKFLASMLIDIQEARIPYGRLSFFSSVWAPSEPPAAASQEVSTRQGTG